MNCFLTFNATINMLPDRNVTRISCAVMESVVMVQVMLLQLLSSAEFPFIFSIAICWCRYVVVYIKTLPWCFPVTFQSSWWMIILCQSFLWRITYTFSICYMWYCQLGLVVMAAMVTAAQNTGGGAAASASPLLILLSLQCFMVVTLFGNHRIYDSVLQCILARFYGNGLKFCYAVLTYSVISCFIDF